MSDQSSPSIRVAIIGGGLAGATLANALIRVPRLQIQVYESAPEFSARGAAIGLSVSSQRALRQILPAADQLLERAGAVPMNSSRAMLGSGPDAGALVFDLTGVDPGKVVHRASLLRELLAIVPTELLHTKKKLTAIAQIGDGVGLSFEDGTHENFDAVIGADGIFSSVRDHVLQDTAAEYAATPAGFWDSRNVVTFGRAKEVLGEAYFEQDRQYGWLGEGAFLMHDVIEHRTKVHCLLGGVETESPESRKRPLTREGLTTTLHSWLDGPIAKGMIDLILDQPNPQGYSQWEHKSTPTYCNGRVCIVGDAAHSMTPYQGAGAGQAFEDAMILGTLFNHISSSSDIEAALRAFDTVRRARCQRIINSSREVGEVFCGQNSDIGLDPARIKDVVKPKWDFIYGLDQEAHKQEALDKLRDLRG